MARTKLNNSQENFSGPVQTYTNTGTAGGTFYYVNLGGIKLFWGFTAAVGPNNATATSYQINFPASFFSSIQSCVITPTGGTAAANQFIGATSNAAATTSNVQFYMIATTQATGNNGTTPCSVFVIGT